MNPLRFWLAIFTLFGFVVIAPGWMYWAGAGLDGVPMIVEWLVAAMLPIILLITIASWLQSGSAYS